MRALGLPGRVPGSLTDLDVLASDKFFFKILAEILVAEGCDATEKLSLYSSCSIWRAGC